MKSLIKVWRRIVLTREQREALEFAERFTSESRMRVADLATVGRANDALHENLALLGGHRGERGRIRRLNSNTDT